MTSDIVEYYSDSFSEDARLKLDAGGTIEWIRTIDILKRFLPPVPSTILDVGGGTGVYAWWLLEQGYKVNLIELVPRHVEIAKKRLAVAADPMKWSAVVGDARNLDFQDSATDIVLLMGPLYHFQESEERLNILREAIRVLKPGGYLFCTIISKFTSFLDGLDSGFIHDPDFRDIIKGDLKNSCHNNHTDKLEYFTTAYFQHPDELKSELLSIGFTDLQLVGIEGVLWASKDLKVLKQDSEAWLTSLDLMRSIESDNSIIGLSPHVMGIGKKPP